MKSLHIFIISLCLLFFTACTNNEHNDSDNKSLSFQGIVLGESIPDSIMQSLESSNLSISDYIHVENQTFYVKPLLGKFSLKGSNGFPIDVNVSVYRHPESGEVYRIILTDLIYNDVAELYKLFCAKYGSPNFPENSKNLSFEDLHQKNSSTYNSCYARWSNINSRNQSVSFGPVEQLGLSRGLGFNVFKIEYVDTDALDDVYSYFVKSMANEEQQRKQSFQSEQERLNNSAVINQDF